VQEWCYRHGKTQGEVLTLEQVWALSQAWYRDRMSPHFRGRTLEQVMHIFDGIGLVLPFWKPST
jgi:hypothetical protein